MAETGFYSVVKYVPDLVRREPVNVGVIVAETDGRVVICFRHDDHPHDPTNASRRFESLLRHLTSSNTPTDGERILMELADRRFSHFEISPPAQLVLESDLEEAANRLCGQLADDCARTR